jgi:alkylation response protein AidB-like acyl-CoA dehydrogenase
VLESKAAAGDVAIAVTSAAMRVCGGAAFSKHLPLERRVQATSGGRRHGADGRRLRESSAKPFLGIPLFERESAGAVCSVAE